MIRITQWLIQHLWLEPNREPGCNGAMSPRVIPLPLSAAIANLRQAYNAEMKRIVDIKLAEAPRTLQGLERRDVLPRRSQNQSELFSQFVPSIGFW